METKIAVSDFRSNLMKVLKEIESGSTVNITSRGKVVAKLIPPDDSKKTARDKLKTVGQSAVLHDIISPVDEKWEAEKT
jgi:prevent-host-death family protein